MIYGYVFLVLILCTWFLGWLIKGWTPVGVLLIFSVIYYASFTMTNIDLLLKVLFLFTGILFIFKGFIKDKLLIYLLLLSIIMYIVSIYGNKFNYYYNFVDSITAFATFITGLILYTMRLSSKYTIGLLKVITLLPIISIVMGILSFILGLTDFFSRSGTAVGGISLATNLSFFGTLGTLAAVILDKTTHRSRYNVLKIINFIIVCLTLTRGGILATIIILFPDILSILKRTFISIKSMLLVASGLILGLIPTMLIVKLIEQRSFENGELNTSGRFDAWKNILSLVNNNLTGNGYGSLKTLTDNPLLSAFTAAHNAYIQSYFETGIVGTALFIIILLIVFINTLKSTGIARKYIVFAILSFLTYSYTDNTVVNFRYWFILMIILGSVSNLVMVNNTGEVRSKK